MVSAECIPYEVGMLTQLSRKGARRSHPPENYYVMNEIPGESTASTFPRRGCAILQPTWNVSRNQLTHMYKK